MLLLACLIAAAGCGDGDGERAPAERPPSTGDARPRAAADDPGPPARRRARGIDRSNEAEVEALVRDVAGPGVRPRCTLAHRAGPGASRFSCVPAGRRYVVDWEHYGTGRYLVSLAGAGRTRAVAHGTLSIGE